MKHIKAKINKKVKRFKIHKYAEAQWCELCGIWVQDLAAHDAIYHS